MTAEVRYMNLSSSLWRDRDSEPYAKCVFFNTEHIEFVFTDLNNQDEDLMCVFFNKDKEVRYLKNIEAAEKIHFWLETKQNVVVARQDEVVNILQRMQETGDYSDEIQPDERGLFLPIEY